MAGLQNCENTFADVLAKCLFACGLSGEQRCNKQKAMSGLGCAEKVATATQMCQSSVLFDMSVMLQVRLGEEVY